MQRQSNDRFFSPTLFVAAAILLAASPSVAATPDLTGQEPPPDGIWVESLDLSKMASGFGRGTAGNTVAGNPISIGGVAFKHGIGTHANSELHLDLAGKATRFIADVGVDDDLKCLQAIHADDYAGVEFSVWVDGKVAARSGGMRFGKAPVRLDIDLTGAKDLRLVMEKLKGARFNHASWGGATLIMKAGQSPPTALAPLGKDLKVPAIVAATSTLSAAEAARVVKSQGDASTVWLDSLNLSVARFNAKPISTNKTTDSNPFRLGTLTYPHGFSSVSEAEIRVELGGNAKRFVARAGIDNNLGCGKVLSGGSSSFEVWVDGRLTAQTSHRHGYDQPVDLSIDLTGAKLLVLIASSDGADAVWGGAHIELAKPGGKKPQTVLPPPPEAATIARRNPEEVRINGPRVIGSSPGKPFLFLVPATGKAPIRYEATGLPAGLELNPTTGVISGAVKKAGSTEVMLKITAANGQTSRSLTIVSARDRLALTPTMGWNSWNVWGLDVDDAKVRAAADNFMSTGLAAQGFQYINIDDGWEEGRDATGNIKTNKKFPDMKALSDYVHGKGLRLGIYSSPGPETCGGFTGSYRHEAQDAKTWASWGIDYLKHDWCSYGGIAKDSSLKELQKPYKIMEKALRATNRDIVYSLCQYGMGDVWNWGREVGGQLWRTTGDIVDTWSSLSEIGFSQSGKETKIGPGGWNDPDMLVVGKLGWSANIRNTRLTPNEQVLHVTLWSMLAAPLLLGNDLTQLDDFTLDLLLNPEVIDIDQDPLGKPGVRKSSDGTVEIWTRTLHDGTTAVAVFNRGQLPMQATVRFADLGLPTDLPVRNIWLRKDLGTHKESYSNRIPSHGAILLKLGSAKP